MAKLYFEDIKEGDTLPPYTVKAGFMELNRFASANNEFVPIHMDPEFSKEQARLPDVIVMGNLKLAYVAQALEGWMGEEGWIKKLEVSYRGMDVVNETLTAKGLVKSKRQEDGENIVQLDVWVENSTGKKTTPGAAVVSLPGKS